MFSLTDFIIQPTLVRVGETVRISVTVTNTGTSRTGVHVYCKLDKTELDVGQTGWLYPGDSRTITWDFVPTEAKTYQVLIQAGEWPYTTRENFFEGMFTASPAGGALPLSISMPATIAPGEDFWASHTVYLPYLLNCRYFISLALVGTGANWDIEITAAEAWFVDHRWMLPEEEKGEYFPRAYPINRDGQYTFTGIPQADYEPLTDTHGPVYQVPAKAKYRKNSLVYPLPEGIYKVVSLGHLRLIEYADKDHASYYDEQRLWTDILMGQVEVVSEPIPPGQFSEFSISDYRKV